MSTVRLLKDHERGRKGSTISVPFGLGQQMVAEKVAEYPTHPAPAVAATTPAITAIAERHAAEIVRLNEQHNRTLAEVRSEAKSIVDKVVEDHAAEIGKLKAELDAANKQITELQAKVKK